MSLVRRVADNPGVLQHNDLGSWNVVVDGSNFVVVDWESMRQHGLPLWDTAYFLADALALLEGAVDGETRHEHTRRLFRGELASSQILFRWIGRSVNSLELPNDAVGPIMALCWMHHAQSARPRSGEAATSLPQQPTRFSMISSPMPGWRKSRSPISPRRAMGATWSPSGTRKSQS